MAEIEQSGDWECLQMRKRWQRQIERHLVGHLQLHPQLRKARTKQVVQAAERLESRVLLTFADLFDVTVLAPTSVSLDDPFDGVWNGDQFEIIGAEANQAALERFDIDGSAEPIVLFDSFTSAASENGDTTGILRAAANTPDGMLYSGQSAGLILGGVEPATPTSWREPDDPRGGVAVEGSPIAGSMVSMSLDGTFVGATGAAAYGEHGKLPKSLPGGLSANVAVSISRDSQHIVGDFIWIANEFGGYNVVNTSGFDFSGSGGGAPTWRGVEIDESGDAFYGASISTWTRLRMPSGSGAKTVLLSARSGGTSRTSPSSMAFLSRQ